MYLSFKDWIGSIRKTSGDIKRLQEDIMSDDNFPDTYDFEEMKRYLKTNNVTAHIYHLFLMLYKEYQRRMQRKYEFYCRKYENPKRGGVNHE